MSNLRNRLSADIGKDKGLQLDAVEQNDLLYKEWDKGDSETDKVLDQQYHKHIFRKIIFVSVCIILAFVSAGMIITHGDYPLEFAEVYQIIWNHILHGAPTDAIEYLKDHVVWELRLPRVLVAIIAGFGLALAGAVMQSTLKNPMADTYTTGVSSGAAFGATLCIVSGFNFISGDFSLLLNAFLFSLAPTALIMVVSRMKGASSTTMILSGLAIMYIFSAMTTALQLWAEPDSLAAIYRWQVGSLNNMLWDDVPVMFVVTLIGSVAIMLLSNKINILSSGDESARALGIDASKLRIICLVIVSLIAASIVSFTGTIGFVGLVAPHVARIFIGSDNRYLIPASAVFGALLLLISDYIGRTIIAPSVLEVGVVTAFIGGPMFLYLIIRQRKEAWN